MRIAEYISERLTSIVITCLSLTTAILAVILFYTIAPRINPLFHQEKAEKVVTNIIQTSSADAALYIQINLDTNSRKYVAGAVRKSDDGPLMQNYRDMAEKTRFTVSGNPVFIYSLISGNVVCQNRATLNPLVAKILLEELKMSPTFKVCSVPVINNSQLLIGYITIVWRVAPPEEQELATIIQAQTEIKVMR